ncbi:MAG: carbon-nitrogen hydrolase, partial [Gemmatimonadetes bacterium]|nr:carbon-nitrogen hydrolase [Gemmatimonadota bacterium]
MANQDSRASKRPKLRLKDFEKKIKLRRLTLEDYENVVQMQQRCFPGMIPWGRDQIESQISLFPEGQLCIEYRGKVVASSNSLIVDYDRYEEWHDWKRVSD